MEENCKLCRFWEFFLTQEFSDKPDIDIGHCRRYPKVFRTESCYLLPTIYECPENKTGIRSKPEYPIHREDDWCGEFKPLDVEVEKQKQTGLTDEEFRKRMRDYIKEIMDDKHIIDVIRRAAQSDGTFRRAVGL